ncbi:hypothetical protein GA0061078_1162 [Bifidobacterium bohemicum]|nr:hypothetical protein [Bifidobacterium bohemicum]SCC01042.1 hypothetical protein GA0061078_1162 [Bifidobacterium bohemicum]
MAEASGIMSKPAKDGWGTPMSWDEFICDCLPCADLWLSYKDQTFMIQTIRGGYWALVDSTRYGEDGNYLVLFLGTKDMDEFTETPIPLLDGRSLHEAWPDIVFVSA